MDAEHLEAMKENPLLYANVIDRKIKRLIKDYEKEQFVKLIRT
jgi:hypothetical protein